MGDSSFRGTSTSQDARFKDKEKAQMKKLQKEGEFSKLFNQSVDMQKVNIDVIKPWIAKKVDELLGFEDDVVSEYVLGMLQEGSHPDPRKMQVNLIGFLEKQTSKFMHDLWTLLLDAQSSIGGIPQVFVEEKKREMREARERDAEALQRYRQSRHRQRESVSQSRHMANHNSENDWRRLSDRRRQAYAPRDRHERRTDVHRDSPSASRDRSITPTYRRRSQSPESRKSKTS